MNDAIHKVGTHYQAGIQNPSGAGQVTHTDYIHPIYGYSRFDGFVPQELCLQRAKQAHEHNSKEQRS